jgi:hypothetical protein
MKKENKRLFASLKQISTWGSRELGNESLCMFSFLQITLFIEPNNAGLI